MPFTPYPNQAGWSLLDILTYGWRLHLTCACGRERALYEAELLERFSAVLGATLAEWGERVVCTECGAREGRISTRQERLPPGPGHLAEENRARRRAALTRAAAESVRRLGTPVEARPQA